MDKFNIQYNIPYTLLEITFDENVDDYTDCDDDGKIIHFNSQYKTEYNKTGERDIYVLLNRIDNKIFNDYIKQVENFDDQRFLKALSKNVVIYQDTVTDNYKHLITYNLLGGINRRG